jgi:hypothetical protein
MSDTYNTILSQLKVINNTFYQRNEDFIRRMERLEQIEAEALNEFYKEYPTYTHEYIPYNYWGNVSDTDDENDNLF